jgi:serine protease
MSAALAAGVAALIRSRFPALTAAQVVQAMERGVGTRPGGRPAAGTGHGALDAAGALTSAAAVAARQAPAAPRPTASGSRLTPAPRATARRSGAGTLAGSLLRDAVIVVVVLIVGLAGALALSSTRRRRRAAATRPPRAGQAGGSHARRPRAALPAAPGATAPRTGIGVTHRAPGGDHGAGLWRGTAGVSGAAPRLAPLPSGSLGRTARGRRGKRGDTAEPPWEPASPPGTVPAVDSWATSRAPRAALPPAGRAPRGTADRPVPPWELAGGEMAAAPVPADLSDLPVSNTGPMYIWNPAASGPLPILNEEDDPGR